MKKYIELLINSIFKYSPDVHVLIVDDNSPDQTSEKIKELKKTHKNIILKGTSRDEVPLRPIASTKSLGMTDLARYTLSAVRPTDRRLHDFMRFIDDSRISMFGKKTILK